MISITIVQGKIQVPLCKLEWLSSTGESQLGMDTEFDYLPSIMEVKAKGDQMSSK